MVQKVFKVPTRAYDLASGELVDATRYFAGQPKDVGVWQSQMIKAQKTKRISYSNEWSSAQRHYPRDSEQELKLVDTVAWTGTVFDFNDETLKEGITLNDDGTFASVKTVLGKKDKIVLPHESAYVKDLDDKHMPLVSYLHGIKNPKKELPDYAYLWIQPDGIRPVVRGHWYHDYRDNRRVDVDADYGPAYRWFAAWLVNENRPENVITPQEYEGLQNSFTVLID